MADKSEKSYLTDLLDSQKQSNQHLRDLVQWEKEGMMVEQQELVDVKDKLSDLHSVVGTAANTAETLSKGLGKEVAFTREISHDMSMAFSKDKEMQVAYKKATAEDKTIMMDQLKESVLARYKLDEKFFGENEKFIENAMVKVDANMDQVVEKGSKMLYPIISGLTRTLDDFRHTVSDKFPKTVGRLLSDEMMEHYKAGAKEIGGHFKTHMSTILAPLDAITGPIIAVSKSLFTIGKTLFSGPTKHEKAIAGKIREIREVLGKQTEETKLGWLAAKRLKLKEMAINAKHWFIDRKLRLKKYFASKGKSTGDFLKKLLIPLLALAVGFIIGYMNQFKSLISPFLSFFKSIGTKFTKIGKFFGKITSKLSGAGNTILKLLTKGPISRIFLAAGKVFGRLYMPLKMLWNFFKDFGKIKEMFAAGDIVGILKHIAASILQPILELPEMFINGLSWLFGSEFQVDFGKDAIMGMIDNVTVWVFDHITVPVMDFITKTIPEFFGKIKEFFDNIIGGVMKTGKKILSFFGFGGGDDEEKEKEEKPTKPKTPKYYNEWLAYREAHSPEGSFTFPQYKKMKESEEKSKEKGETTKVIDVVPSLTAPEKAKSEQKKAQLNSTQMTNEKLDTTNNKLTETNKTNQQIVQNQQNINVSVKDEIPTETENVGVLFMNNVWGT